MRIRKASVRRKLKPRHSPRKEALDLHEGALPLFAALKIALSKAGAIKRYQEVDLSAGQVIE